MIERHTVRWTSEKFIREHLHEYPGTIRTLIESPDYVKFIDLCLARARDMNRCGMIKSQFTLFDFVRVATREYCTNIMNERLRSYERKDIKLFEVVKNAGSVSEAPPEG